MAVAVLGLGMSACFFVTGPADVAWISLVLALLLLPTYLLIAHTPRRLGPVAPARPGGLIDPSASDPSEAGEILVVRPSGYFVDVFRRYRIMLDGELAGMVKRGESLSVHVQPGSHVISARIDWAGSRDHTIEVKPGATVTMTVTPGSPTGIFTASGEYLLLAVTS